MSNRDFSFSLFSILLVFFKVLQFYKFSIVFLLNYCCSVTQLCPMICDPVYCSMPGLPVPHHLPEFAQVHFQCAGDAIQPSHPLRSSSPSVQQQGLFQ